MFWFDLWSMERFGDAPKTLLDPYRNSKCPLKIPNHWETLKVTRKDWKKCSQCWATCLVNWWKEHAQKLRTIILPQFKVIPCRFSFGRSLKPSLLWFRDLGTCPFFPIPIMVIFGDTRIPQIIQKKPDNLLGLWCFWISKLGNSFCGNVGKGGDRKSQRFVSWWHSWIRNQ